MVLSLKSSCTLHIILVTNFEYVLKYRVKSELMIVLFPNILRSRANTKQPNIMLAKKNNRIGNNVKHPTIMRCLSHLE